MHKFRKLLQREFKACKDSEQFKCCSVVNIHGAPLLHCAAVSLPGCTARPFVSPSQHQAAAHFTRRSLSFRATILSAASTFTRLARFVPVKRAGSRCRIGASGPL